MSITIRVATLQDATAIAKLVWELARSMGEVSPLTEGYIPTYLSSTANRVLLAEEQDEIVGLLSYSLRPNLYHSGDVCLIEELIVSEKARGRGIGSRMLTELLNRMPEHSCAEISVTTLPDNRQAIEFYRKHGFEEEGILLEIHPPQKRNDQ